jgi:hypothetical protein
MIPVISDGFRGAHIGAPGDTGINTPSVGCFAAQATGFPIFQMGSCATIRVTRGKP